MNIVDDFIAPPCFDEVQVLYHDADILLIDKPSKLLSLSGKNPLNKDSVHFRIVSGRIVYRSAEKAPSSFPAATLAHRLDFGTSGVMVVALSKFANTSLTKQFQDRSVSKSYLAVLEGLIGQDSGTIELPIAKDKSLFPLQKICAVSGKLAQTEYEVIERLSNPDRTRVVFRPTTGRTHQLRIHSLELGHPILGCDLYKSRYSEDKAERLLLHASHIQFIHPRTGRQFNGYSACPF